jgi:hypothetical protein
VIEENRAVQHCEHGTGAPVRAVAKAHQAPEQSRISNPSIGIGANDDLGRMSSAIIVVAIPFIPLSIVCRFPPNAAGRRQSLERAVSIW